MAVYGNMVVTNLGKTLYGKVQTGATLTFTRMQIGSGQLAASSQLSAALTSGTAYTSLSVPALMGAIPSGSTIVIGTGGTTQTVTTSAQALVGATSISVTSFSANAAYASGTALTVTPNQSTLTALITPIGYVTINSISASNGTANIRGIFENTSLTASTYTCEIGLFAQDPTAGEILYAYANAGAQGDTIPPYADGPYSRQFQLNSAIGNATSVTANIPANTYVPTTEVGAANGVASLDANINVVEMKPVVADIFGTTSVVLSGGVATKDGTTATQLDVTLANVYFATGEHINFAASTTNQFKTSTASTTYYLDYNNDGTASFATAHSAKTGYVPICSVATDASGNISTVTDARPMTVELFNGASKVDGSKLVNLPIPPVNPATGTSLGTVELPPSAGSPTTPTATYRAACVQESKLTTTSATNVLTFTPSANGNFMVGVSLRVVTAATTITVTITWTDATGAETDTRINAQSLSVGTHDIPLKFLNAVTGQPIAVNVTAGTINQAYASASIVGV